MATSRTGLSRARSQTICRPNHATVRTNLSIGICFWYLFCCFNFFLTPLHLYFLFVQIFFTNQIDQFSTSIGPLRIRANYPQGSSRSGSLLPRTILEGTSGSHFATLPNARQGYGMQGSGFPRDGTQFLSHAGMWWWWWKFVLQLCLCCFSSSQSYFQSLCFAQLSSTDDHVHFGIDLGQQ